LRCWLASLGRACSITPCNAFDTKNPPLAPLLWLFYVSKVFDFMDTVFIILGKKWAQVPPPPPPPPPQPPPPRPRRPCRPRLPAALAGSRPSLPPRFFLVAGGHAGEASWRCLLQRRLRVLEKRELDLRVGALGQLSFLHVYHHLTIFMFYWVNANIGYDGGLPCALCARVLRCLVPSDLVRV
jgi:hypothetical protein